MANAPTEPSLFRHFVQEPMDAYNANRATHITSTALNVFRKSPRLLQRTMQAPERFPQREHHHFGQAAHVYLLEGAEAFHTAYTVADGPINRRTGDPYGKSTKTYQAWLEEQPGQVISTAEFNVIEEIAANLVEHSHAADLLSEGGPELTLRGEYRGLPCQVRVDWLNPNGVVDFKTTRYLSNAKHDAYRYGYVHQAAFYRRVINHLTGTTLPHFLIAAEKEEPYAVGVWRINETDLEHFAHEVDATLDHLAGCLATDHWPTGYEQLREWSATSWQNASA